MLLSNMLIATEKLSILHMYAALLSLLDVHIKFNKSKRRYLLKPNIPCWLWMLLKC